MRPKQASFGQDHFIRCAVRSTSVAKLTKVASSPSLEVGKTAETAIVPSRLTCVHRLGEVNKNLTRETTRHMTALAEN